MIRGAILLLALAIVWLLLSGHFTGLLLVLGALSCVYSWWIYERMEKADGPVLKRLRIGAQVRYILWLTVEIVKSNIMVIRGIIHPDRISPAFFDVDTARLDEFGKVVYANSITLTPGTVTVEVQDAGLHVHSLINQARQDLESGEMLRRVAHATTGGDGRSDSGTDRGET